MLKCQWFMPCNENKPMDRQDTHFDIFPLTSSKTKFGLKFQCRANRKICWARTSFRVDFYTRKSTGYGIFFFKTKNLTPFGVGAVFPLKLLTPLLLVTWLLSKTSQSRHFISLEYFWVFFFILYANKNIFGLCQFFPIFTLFPISGQCIFNIGITNSLNWRWIVNEVLC